MTEKAQAKGRKDGRENAVIHPLTIGSVNLANNLILGPMAGVSDLPFRLLCHEQGAGLVCTEMVSAKAIAYKNRNTRELLKVSDEERPVSLQIFGSDPVIMAEQARQIEDLHWDILDINMGCPVPKVFNNGDGSALLRNPLLAGQIIEAVAGAIHKPLTVKIRLGVSPDTINAVEMAHIAQESGAAAVAVHGRTRDQFYMGAADWEQIARVKQAVSIPVIGNGDIKSPADVQAMYEQTGVDAYMIARAAQGNPWIFRQILHFYQEGEEPVKPGPQEMCDTMLRQARMMCDLKGEYSGIREMRKQAAWYTAGYPRSARLRGMVNDVETYEDLEQLFRAYFGLS